MSVDLDSAQTIQEGDFVEILDVLDKQVFRIQDVSAAGAEGAAVVVGQIVSPSGDKLEMTKLLNTPPHIKPVNDDRGNFFVVRHPLATTILGSPTNSKWFTTRKDSAKARQDAEKVKQDWEQKLLSQILEHTTSRLCLCGYSTCSRKASDTSLLHVSSWKLIGQTSLSGNVLQTGMNPESNQVRESSAKAIKLRGDASQPRKASRSSGESK